MSVGQRGLLATFSGSGSRARLMVLMFHQVTAEPDPLLSDVPDAALFEQQMRWLAEWCNVFPLTEAAVRLGRGDLPSRAVAITFDDGYANNLTVAAPILKRLGLPATFFVTGGAIEDGIMWNDLVIEAVRGCGDELDLNRFGLGQFEFASAEDRRSAITALLLALKYRPLAQRRELAEDLHAFAINGPTPRLMMTPDQVAELATDLFDIGAHTINHPILKELADDDARSEIERSRDWVAEVTGRVPKSFAYPNGRPDIDYAIRHVQMLRDAGFDVACSTAWGCADRQSPQLELPRFAPWETSRNRFWSRLIKTALVSHARPPAYAST
jgi:peptidoglycan/xylan/chitin deacetylase (PgdA/CDA1 family)